MAYDINKLITLGCLKDLAQKVSSEDTIILNRVNTKYDKSGGNISGDVDIDGDLTFNIADPDYDVGIDFSASLDTNLGTLLTLSGYANGQSATSYRPILRNIGTQNSSYDAANKKYVDDQVVLPTRYLVFLNADGTVDTYSSSLDYTTVSRNLTNPREKDVLDIVWGTTRFLASDVEITDVNNGDIKFIADIEYQGIHRHMVFTLDTQSTLTTTSITTSEIISNKKQSVVNNLSSDYYTSTSAVYNEFQRKPVVIWESSDPSTYLLAINADLSTSPAWQLTTLDMTPYKRVKIYSCAGRKSSGVGIDASTTPAMILEMSLDPRSAISEYGGNFVGSMIVQKPNDANRFASLTCAISADKTSFVVLRQSSLYGTAATSNNDANANVFLIEGYYD